MSDTSKFREDGEPDGRGRSEGSKTTQFAKGDNRKRPGRPKGALSLKTIYLEAGKAKMSVSLNGVERRIPKIQAVVMKQVDMALKGEQRAAERMIERFEQYSPMEVEVDLSARLMAEDQAILDAAFERGILGATPAYDETSPVAPRPEDDDDSVAQNGGDGS